ncbi:MAG: ribonuclease PH [Alphaproteobacteria bacterium]|nr:MAG: ribonuclease PH [Alphaproteobacteria bacterium]
MRTDNRPADQLRDVSLTTGVNPHAEGSCLIKFGLTEVLCTASVQDKVPQWLKGKGQGWITAEYGMLPRATADRKDREATRGKQEGRTLEIQRLIGRSLRSVVNLKAMDGLTIWLDCDVIVADGGTRTAAITGSYIALAIALQQLDREKRLKGVVLSDQVAAVSCGLTDHGVVLDMDYLEDSNTKADANFVMAGNGNWIELQMSAEKTPVASADFGVMQAMAEKGIRELMELQRQALGLVSN